MTVVGIVGGSGAGKSLLCAFLEKEGIPCLNTDITARQVVEKGKPCLCELCEEFGEDILMPDGSLNRKALAEKAFSDPEKHKRLNAITHAYISKEVLSWIEAQRLSGKSACGIDAPLLFESGLDSVCNVTVAVTASEEVRVKRITKRDGISREQALLRIKNQKSNAELCRLCDVCVENSGDEAELMEKAAELVKTVLGR